MLEKISLILFGFLFMPAYDHYFKPMVDKFLQEHSEMFKKSQESNIIENPTGTDQPDIKV